MSRRLSVAEQQALVRQIRDQAAAPAQRRAAADQLLASCSTYLRNLARHVARQTGATKVEEDLHQEACLVFLLRAREYDPARYTQGFGAARVENYAYPWIRSRLFEVACDALESVRNPHAANAHAAHREVDAGADPAEVAARHDMSTEAVVALLRHTVSLDEARDVSCDESPEDALAAEHARRVALKAWEALRPTQQLALALLGEVDSEQMRAKICRVSVPDLRRVERSAKEALVQAAARYDGGDA